MSRFPHCRKGVLLFEVTRVFQMRSSRFCIPHTS